MSEKVKVIIADSDRAGLNYSLTLIGLDDRFEVAGEAQDSSTLLSNLEKSRPDVILMDINLDELKGIQAAERISREYPLIPIVMTSNTLDLEIMRSAMLAGVKDFVLKGISSEVIKEAIIKVYKSESDKKEQVLLMLKKNKGTEEGQQTTQILTFVSGKGGVGKTTLVVNLAIALVQAGKRVALVDLDLMFGDCTLLLDLTPKRAIHHIVEDSCFDDEQLNNYLTIHSSGLTLLAAPFKPEQGELINGWHIEQILHMMNGKYDFIILDTGNEFHETLLAALDHSTSIFLVQTPTISSLRATKTSIELLLHLNYRTEIIKLILNRSAKNQGVKRNLIEDALNRKIYWEMKGESKVFDAGNEGSPFVLSYPNETATKQIHELVERLTGKKTIKEKRKLFSFFKRVREH